MGKVVGQMRDGEEMRVVVAPSRGGLKRKKFQFAYVNYYTSEEIMLNVHEMCETARICLQRS